MVDGMYRIGIVGATSLAGKELSDELQESLLATSDFILLDDEGSTGQMASVGDEAALIQRIEPTSFDRMDFVFFSGDKATTAKHWRTARKAGASIVDMTYALELEEGVPIRAPWASETLKAAGTSSLSLETLAVVSAHPAAVMLALVAARIEIAMRAKSVAATLIEPASQHGREAMDELHQQTVNLLSFQNLPKEQYDAQVAFNLLPKLGESAKVVLNANADRIARHYEQVGEGRLPPLDLQLVQAPVFHGYVASVLLELHETHSVADVERALTGESITVVADDSDPPSNLSAAGQEDILVWVRSTEKLGGASTRFWLWIAVDNLKLGAMNAIASANELRRLRPRGKVQ